ncbi:MAG: YjbQ family protein [Candidatus Diapherotrites archaeon]|uniref:YjbQ family protein n=1 Tax=Candidatus Iainarchaeum sp. TaxID=3101447 RepID=A0A8T3YPE3_9ARCH|nr:YjbQ family protein [Candidatus Diapherotrites archaeon]
MTVFTVQTYRRNEMLDITQKIQGFISSSGVKSGLVIIYVPHTTAAITVNEGHDLDVAADFLEKLSRLAPQGEQFYRHFEGNSDAHVKASLVGCSVSLPVDNSSLVLGTWQKIFLCEFDGPRTRKVFLKVLRA